MWWVSNYRPLDAVLLEHSTISIRLSATRMTVLTGTPCLNAVRQAASCNSSVNFTLIDCPTLGRPPFCPFRRAASARVMRAPSPFWTVPLSRISFTISGHVYHR